MSTTIRSEAWWHRKKNMFNDKSSDAIPEDPGKLAWKIAKGLFDRQSEDKRSRANAALVLYFGNTDNSLDAYTTPSLPFAHTEIPGYNVIQSCTDTKTSHIVRNRVRPLIAPERASSEVQMRAKLLQTAVETTLDEFGLYGETAVDLCFDGNLFEGACFKVIPDYQNMRVIGERVFPWEVFISKREGRLKRHRQTIHIYKIDRSELIGRCDPNDRRLIQAILEAKAITDDVEDDSIDGQDIADEVRVAELWHLPSIRVDRSNMAVFGLDSDGEYSEKIDPGHDGRHMLVLDGGHVIIDEPWPYDYCPIARYLPMPKPVGAWSRGIPETLAGCQLALNRMNDRIDRIMSLHARPLLYLWRRARVNPDKITNDIATILTGDVAAGQALQYIVPQSVPAEYLSQRDKLIAWGEKQAGFNDMNIAAAKPAGINHAPGLQHLSDETSIRHTTSFRAWERFHVHIFRAVSDCYRLLATYAKRSNQDFKLALGHSRDLEQIDFEELDIKEERFRWRVWPTNLLPQTPAAKADRILSFLDRNLFDGSPASRKALKLLDSMDLDAIVADESGARENIERKLDAIQREGWNAEYGPHPYMDLAMAMQICAERINRLEANGEDPEEIEGLIHFHKFARKMHLDMMAEQQAAMQPQAPAQPPEQPGAPVPPQL